jgi:hypothetical protein
VNGAGAGGSGWRLVSADWVGVGVRAEMDAALSAGAAAAAGGGGAQRDFRVAPAAGGLPPPPEGRCG